MNGLTLGLAPDGAGGITATVGGADAGALVTLSSALADPSAPSLDMAARATRTGPGTLAVGSPKGLHWFMATSLKGGVPDTSPVVAGWVTDPAPCVHYRAMLAVQSTLGMLGLAGIPGSRVYLQGFPAASNVEFPCVVLHLANVQDQGQSVLNSYDDEGLPVAVLLCDTAPAGGTFDPAEILGWRHRVKRSFNAQRLAGVREVYRVDVEPGVVIDEKLPEYQHLVTGLTLRCWARLARGFGA